MNLADKPPAAQIDSAVFKAGMRRLAAAVCLITSVRSDGSRIGLTATAVSSVTADPPTLLCCINRGSASHAAIRAAGVFAVNVLALEDRILADRFASQQTDWEGRFQQGLWLQLQTGSPVLESALASFDCRIAQAVDVGTHGIIFGEIQAIRVRDSNAKSLLYAHGSYGGFASYVHEQSAELLWMPPWEDHRAGG
jgi:flavin reductase (NADH)/flavin reductase